MSYNKKIGSGDNGYTDFYNIRVKKTDDRVLLLSYLDMVLALIGILRSKNKKLEDILLDLQKDISLVSANISGYIDDKELKNIIRKIEDKIKNNSDINIRKFIFFGKNYTSAMLNLIRSKIRICEIIAWRKRKKTSAIYLNRLSDFLFLLAVKYEK